MKERKKEKTRGKKEGSKENQKYIHPVIVEAHCRNHSLKRLI